MESKEVEDVMKNIKRVLGIEKNKSERHIRKIYIHEKMYAIYLNNGEKYELDLDYQIVYKNR